ncbi:MAG: 30S ribosomal protein S13 [Planctomycetes bacterium]|nr:30S ribosomal protein S13 [Planctomycetota bacterium]
MPRVVGVEIPNDKRIEIALTYIFGIGRFRANEILGKAGINKDVRTRDLTDDELSRLNASIESNYETEGQLRRAVFQNINRLKEINCYRGLRHRKNLPVRGQRTKTNARTRKGPRKVVAVKRSVKALH